MDMTWFYEWYINFKEYDRIMQDYLHPVDFELGVDKDYIDFHL